MKLTGEQLKEIWEEAQKHHKPSHRTWAVVALKLNREYQRRADELIDVFRYLARCYGRDALLKKNAPGLLEAAAVLESIVKEPKQAWGVVAREEPTLPSQEEIVDILVKRCITVGYGTLVNLAEAAEVVQDIVAKVMAEDWQLEKDEGAGHFRAAASQNIPEHE